ncbi:MAG TPA: endonuclease VII domain-containing protein [Mycobacteriales bacterium]|nr:endonuclease VII domain-containing protein [Mycobacteriales bacterium]
MSLRTQSSYARRQQRAGKSVKKREALPPEVKRCPDCGEIKFLDDFPRNKSARDGHGGYCKPCHNARTRATAERLYGGGRSYHLKARYGITIAEYDAMLEAQAGLCALCRERPAEHVDHDHLFGHVRGLLCSCCNQGLGNFRDELAHVQAAAHYLERTTWRREQVSPGVFQLTSPRPAAAASPSSSRPPLQISSLRG